MRVAPEFEPAAIDVLLADIESAVIADLAVDDRQLAVITVIQRMQLKRLKKIKVRINLHPGRPQFLYIIALKPDAAETVVQHSYRHSLFYLLDKYFLDPLSQTIGAPYEIFQMDKALGRLHVFAEGIEFFLSVMKDPY